jgi:acrylyl-CoA reductase (NADPH)
MTETIRALIADETDGKVKGVLSKISTADLPDEEVLVGISYSTLNYKDALAITGRGKICRKTPMVCGIDLAGTVIESRSEEWKPGDRVLVNGFGLSETHWGGYAEQQRLKAEWLIRIPDTLSEEESMAIGTAGYTAMLCIQAIQDRGVDPSDGPVVVTGATGGVGTVAVMLLAKLGYEVVAATGRAEQHSGFLNSLGASRVMSRDELDRECRPLEKETWAAAVDTVGDKMLATVLAQTRYEGIVTACGLAGGIGLPSTVLPFILRGVTLRGIDSVMARRARRLQAWSSLASLVNKEKLREIYTVEPFEKLPQLAESLFKGGIRGRVVIDIKA